MIKAWRGLGAWMEAVLNQAIHHITMQWLLGPIHSLTAMIKEEVKMKQRMLDWQFEFKNGVLGNIEVSTALRPKN